MKNILIIGSGGREHAVAKHFLSNREVKKIWVAPGNHGMMVTPNLNVVTNLSWKNPEKILTFCKENIIDWVLVSTDNALASGLVNQLQKHQIKCFGPTQEAARLESSKIFSKNFMQRHAIPTARVLFSGTWEKALDFLTLFQEVNKPLVLKADGLALGKGVVVCSSVLEARVQISFLKEHSHILIEEYLKGEEVSFFYFANGESSLFLGAACDHKRLRDGDLGPNTGGMGAYSYEPSYDLLGKVTESIVNPVLKGMEQEACSFNGILFVGLMLTQEGPKVIEFNARLGDPETQCLFPLFEAGSLLSAFESVVNCTLKHHKPFWMRKNMASVHVVKVSEGYPSSQMLIGRIVSGIQETSEWPEFLSFFSASLTVEANHYLNSGGRVFGVTALGETHKQASLLAYEGLKKINFEGQFFRKDIGCRK